MWNTVLVGVNLVAFAAWLVLILAPRKPAVIAAILYLGVGALCLVYTLGMIHLMAGGGGGAEPMPDLLTTEGIRALFASDAPAAIGWTHYLAFDLFIGVWIARDADDKGFSRLIQAPFLLLTYLVGPVGLLAWLVTRERRARHTGRWS